MSRSKEEFDRLYESAYPVLYRTALAIVGEPAAAEDCVQEACLKAYRAWARFREDAPAEAWLHRILVNQAISWRRHERLRSVGEVVRRLGRPDDRGGEPSAGQLDLIRELRALPPKQAAAIVLRHVHGFTNRDIAYALGIPERTVASRLAAAKRALRERLEEADQRAPAPPVSTSATPNVLLNGNEH